ncbi:TetR/AcrR family transcriptional regulator [Spongiactinospora sp. 9N601]|uniref:TetR/AcrR family transcriptional regulator n=1 Tax=Spongiactinospora sp. 9N601 TaxID=3375149 RepID=UPI003791F9BD
MRQRGRPRSFDRDKALREAITIFWERGYEGASIAELAQAMGIGAPSLYAAFGDKRRLFDEAVTVYTGGDGEFARIALREEPTAEKAIARVLRESAEAFTREGHPPGCLVFSAGDNSTTPEVVELLRARRTAGIAEFRRRIQADIDAGRLPAGTDAGALAQFYGAVLAGMSQQARDGATTEQLLTVATAALCAWP